MCGACTTRGSGARRVTGLGRAWPCHSLVAGPGEGGGGGHRCLLLVGPVSFSFARCCTAQELLPAPGGEGRPASSAYLGLLDNAHKPSWLLLTLTCTHTPTHTHGGISLPCVPPRGTGAVSSPVGLMNGATGSRPAQSRGAGKGARGGSGHPGGGLRPA